MKSVEQLELPLWGVLHAATAAPDAANLQHLLAALDATLPELDTVNQLQVAAEAIAQITQVFHERSLRAFEQLEARHDDTGPVMPSHAFDQYVRQTTDLDLEQFLEPPPSLPRKSSERSAIEEGNSVVGAVDQAALLQALDQQMSQTPGLTEAEAFNNTLDIAHDEDISAWAERVAQGLGERSAISLRGLQQSLQMPLVQLWLALLLGGYQIEQRGEFYDAEQVWILGRY